MHQAVAHDGLTQTRPSERGVRDGADDSTAQRLDGTGRYLSASRLFGTPNTDDCIHREEKSLLGRFCYRFSCCYCYRLADVDRDGRRESARIGTGDHIMSSMSDRWDRSQHIFPALKKHSYRARKRRLADSRMFSPVLPTPRLLGLQLSATCSTKLCSMSTAPSRTTAQRTMSTANTGTGIENWTICCPAPSCSYPSASVFRRI